MTGSGRSRTGSASRFALALVAVVLLVPVASAFAAPSAIRPDAATLSLSPNFGHPQGSSTAKGKGYQPLETVHVLFDGAQVASASADSAGAFSAPFTVPAAASPGEHKMTARGLSSGDQASKNFLVRTAWSQFRFDEGHSGLNPYENTVGVANAPTLTEGWSRITGGPVASAPTYFGGVVIVGSNDHVLRGIVPATNRLKWSATLDGPILAAPAEEPPGPPTCPPGPPVKIFAATDSSVGSVYGLDTSGRIVWHKTMGAPVISSILMFAPGPPEIPPGPCRGLIVVTDHSGLVRAFDPGTGDIVWSKQVTGAPTTPAGSVDTQDNAAFVFVTTSKGHVYALDAVDGSILWSVAVSGAPTSPAVTHGFNPQPDPPAGDVVFGTNAGSVWTFDGNTGGLVHLWAAGGAVSKAPAIGDVNGDGSADVVLAANVSVDGRGGVQPFPTAVELTAFNSDGSVIWSRSQSAKDNSQPTLANGLVLIGSDDHEIHIDSWATGAPLFSFATKGDVRSSPMLADGRVVVGSNDHHVYEFQLP